MVDGRDKEMTATRDIDEITLAVVQGMLESTTREMTVTMANTCRSPILKLAHDFSNAIFDWVPQMVIQGEDIPNHLGALMYSCRDVAAYFGDDTQNPALNYTVIAQHYLKRLVAFVGWPRYATTGPSRSSTSGGSRSSPSSTSRARSASRFTPC